MSRLGLALLITMLFTTQACIVPPPVEREPDAGGRSQPQFLSDLTVPPFGRFTQCQSAPNKLLLKTFSVGLYDPDDQPLYFRLFLQGKDKQYAKYNEIVPISGAALVAGKGKRAAVFDIPGLCDALVNYTVQDYILEFHVSDSGFENGADLRVPIAGGAVASSYWVVSCDRCGASTDGGS